MEIWKEVKNYEGCYEVSNLGNVRSITRKVERTSPSGGKALYTYYGKMCKPYTTKKGYLRLNLSLNNKLLNHQIHRLVAINFIENKDNKEQVNHINGIKTDNRVENLEWVTNNENIKHSCETGLYKRPNNSGRPKKRVIDLKSGIIYDSISDLIKELKLSRQVYKWLDGESKNKSSFRIL